MPRLRIHELRAKPFDEWTFEERFRYVATRLCVADGELGRFLTKYRLRDAHPREWVREFQQAITRGEWTVKEPLLDGSGSPGLQRGNAAIPTPREYQEYVARQELGRSAPGTLPGHSFVRRPLKPHETRFLRARGTPACTPWGSCRRYAGNAIGTPVDPGTPPFARSLRRRPGSTRVTPARALPSPRPTSDEVSFLWFA